ncbi:hypothetical protein EAH89_17255 [Roseomonas nepalensis]|uniref:Uncharacterized protein n=1 Tax=Muricoccus nepalensis TaxID=1854500 RepID=A0A502FUW9_9PROT|nr:hypothetical protein [Roseomonas nepalensis]TPG53265.1 hypothetical protein EAH89_17255 [Roseomonas nepalensis]
MLDAVFAAFPASYTYFSPDGMVVLADQSGAMLRSPIALGPDAEDTGGIGQFRSVLRLRTADFPDGTEPEQGAYVVVEGERSMITDVLTDPRGWSDCPLALAPE